MMKNNRILLCTLLILVNFVIPTSVASRTIQPSLSALNLNEDLNPQVNILVTVTIKEIRALDMIDRFSDPDFYVKVTINDKEFISDVWQNMNYVTDPEWSATCDVPDDAEWVPITIQLWDWELGRDKLCDISMNDGTKNDSDVTLFYSIKTGRWDGEDYAYPVPIIFDPSGYGRLNGCDDNTMYEEDRDCELRFDITQNDEDGDSIPYWTEVHTYGTDPSVDNRGEDTDDDGIPIEWEHKWGYSPISWDDHRALDPDQDGLDNVEEYLTSQWGSDPFRRDIFLELDQMELGPNGEGNAIPSAVKDRLRDSYAKYNIVYIVDDGSLGGGEFIPFDENTTFDELESFYWSYFMHADPTNWRRGVFRYALVIYNSADHCGFVFNTEVNDTSMLDSIQISTKYHERLVKRYNFFDSLARETFNKEDQRAGAYAGVLMHETGHTLGIFNGNTPGCDDGGGVWPWQKNFWKWTNYYSVMNYRYVYSGLVDYSDGSRGKNDFNDLGRIDLTLFQRSIW